MGEVARLRATKAYILGSQEAVAGALETSLAAMFGAENVHRIGGPTRYETAQMVAAEAVALQGAAYDGTAFVATGLDFPDALAASPLAAANGWPVYLVGSTLTPSTLAAMKAAGVRDVHVLGSAAAVPAGVESALKVAFGDAHVDRLAGADRYGTAAAVAEYGVARGGLFWSHLGVATGENFPDALAGGVLQGTDYSVMLLTRNTSVPAPTREAATRHRGEIYDVRWFGRPSVVTTATREAVAKLLY